jgi:hypothetical protein
VPIGSSVSLEQLSEWKWVSAVCASFLDSVEGLDCGNQRSEGAFRFFFVHHFPQQALRTPGARGEL